MKKLIPFVLLLAAALARCQSTSADKPIDYSTKAVPLATALAQLSQVAGQKLIVTDELAAEPVVLRLKGVSLKDLEAKLANEFVAEWVPAQSGLQLTRTPAVVEAFQKQLAQKRLAAFQKSINELVPIAKSGPLDDNEAHRIAATYVKLLTDEKNGTSTEDGTAVRFALANRTADIRLLASMAVAIGAEKLSSLPAGRHIFSLSPTPMQLPVEGMDGQVVQEYVQQRNLLAKAILAIMPKNVFDGYGDTAMSSSTRTAKGPIRPLLEVDSDPDSDGGWLNVIVYDADGQAIINQGWSFGNSFNPREYGTERAKAGVASKDEQPVALSSVESDLADRYGSSRSAPKPLEPEALDTLANPDRQDPFTIAFSTILLAQAERENRNLIASVADDYWRLPRMADKTHAKPSLYELTMTAFKRVDYERPEGWLIVRSKNPVSASENRIDRTALGEFCRAWIDKGYASLEDWAAMATHVHPRDDGALVWDYWNLLRGQKGMDYVNEWDALRLYGGLSQSQLDQLSAGGSLAFHTLTPEQQDALTRIVYEEFSLRYIDQNHAGPRNVDQSPMVEGIEGEATESIPNGISPNALLTARTSDQPLLYVTQDMAGGISRQMSLNELAMWLVQEEDPRPGDEGEEMRVQGVQLGTKRTITFDLALTDKIQAETQLREDQLQKGGPIAPADLKSKLPPDVWEKLQKAMEMIRQQRKKMGPPPPEPPPATPPPSTN